MNYEHIHATAPRMLRVAGILTAGLALGLVVRNLAAEQSKASIEARLQAVEDRLAIEQLMFGDYSKALDSNNMKARMALFTDDAELRLERGQRGQFEPKVYKGRAEVERGFMSPPPGGGPPPQPTDPGEQMVSGKHVMSNFSVQLNGDQATVRAYWTTIGMMKNGKAVVDAIARYDNTFKRVNGTWKISRLMMTDYPEGGAMTMPGAGTPPGAPPAAPAKR